MGSSFTPQLKKLLLSQGCRFERQGKGDHEIWFSPITQRRFKLTEPQCKLTVRLGKLPPAKLSLQGRTVSFRRPR